MDWHAKYSPSSAEKWVNCPGYIDLLEKVTTLYGSEQSSEAADEGTAAHELAAKILSARNPTRALREMCQDVETQSALELYIDTVEYELDKYFSPDTGAGAQLHVEIPMKLTEFLGGTADCVIVHPNGVVIVDLKYGKQVFVSEESLQLQIYGYLAAKHFNLDLKDNDFIVELIVVQPRCKKSDTLVRRRKIGMADLISETEKLLPAGAFGKDAPSENVYNAGEHCQWCYAKPLCPAKKEVFMKALEAGKDMENPTNLKFILDNAAEMQSIIKKAYSLAVRGLETGGVKAEELGRGLQRKLSNRVWTHPAEKLAPLLRRHGMPKDKVWTSKIVSPAQAEKYVDGKWLSKYTDRKEGGFALVEIDKADPSLLGSVTDELADFTPEPEPETKPEEKPMTKPTEEVEF
jgi:hypothetical protein